ncbi:hypothetical protein SAY86_029377 [Trapa natans]|uniref:Uncharacterized protein n=1 Tax=Trapa natans TaxID=22666 RepID=A0AAN7M143_TRANT|nr:hypothetical protein SAY86_029377 [Trapa natans]
MEVAKLHAAESAANFKEVLKREKKTLTKFQSWEKQKALIREELRCEKAKLRKLLQEVEQAKNHKNQVEVMSWSSKFQSAILYIVLLYLQYPILHCCIACIY